MNMQQTMSQFTIVPFSVYLCLVTLFLLCTESFPDRNGVVPSSEPSFSSPLLVKRDQRTPIVATEFGEISAVQIGDGYHLQFITLEPNALLLPLILHSDMVFFVHTGSGIINWVEEESERTLELRRGDVYMLRSGTVFYVHSNLERDEVPEKLRVYAIFDVGKCLNVPCLGAYSSIRDLSLGFDDRTLQSAFAVPEDVLKRIRDATKPPLIINALPRNRTLGSEEDKWQSRLVRLFVRVEDVTDHLAMKPIVDTNKKKSRAFNVFDADPDFENINGRSIVVDEKDLNAFKDSRFGVFMVNLTKGSMMGPHWNPSSCEISIVLQGEGMIRVVNQQLLSSYKNDSKSERFIVEEGDVFVVPKFHPMAQMSFQNSAFVFMGFSTSAKVNHPQFLVGKSSVLKVLDREVLAASFNLSNETIKGLLEAQKESVILDCVSCAEGELAKLMREIEERKRREEEKIERRRKEEEEARKREEQRKKKEEEAKRREEERKRREEEAEEARKREEERERGEEKAKRQEEERRRREEEEKEARKREEEREKEEEMAKKREEERQKKEREEVERKRREEEARKRREEEEIERRRKEEEEARKREQERKREEEEAKRREEEREEEEAEEARKREEEREREEEKAKRQEEERRRREEEEKEAKKREEEKEKEERQKKEREEVERKRREEERKREEEMAKRREEERQRKEREELESKRREEQERKRREEEARKREEEIKREEEMAKRREEERQRKEREEIERKRREEEAMRREEERKREEEAAKRAEERRKREEEEETKRRWPPQPQPLFTAGRSMAGES